MEILITVVIVLTLLSLGLLAFLISANSAARRDISGQSASVGLLQQQLEALKAVQDKLREEMQKSLQAGQENVNKSLQVSQQTISKLHSQIGELQGTNKQMMQLGTEVKRLQTIFESPKLRGQLGEWSLENLLNKILPQGSFQLQYTFKNGRKVDALIRLAEFSVPIDAKFPLPNFEAMTKAEDADQKKRLRKDFIKDVKNHIDKIAESYILPAEGTLDFALMYVPAENVYYETVVKTADEDISVQDYALEKKVIPISPNLLYAYLMTVVMGLHGLQIEKQAAEIRQNLGKLSAGFENFTGNWDVLGKHLRNAQSQYDEGQTKLNKFTLQLNQIQTKDEEVQSQQ